MATKSVKRGSELTQVLIMTLFITSGFLALACLVFAMLIPSRRADAKKQEVDLNNLVKMFRDDKPDGLRRKRDRLKAFQGQGDQDKDLRGVVEANRTGLGDLNWSVFKAMESKPEPKAKATKYTQPIEFKNSSMQDAFFLIARVRKARPGARASKMSFRPSRSNPGKWDIKLEFQLYENEEVKKRMRERAKRMAKLKEKAKPPPRPTPGAKPLSERRRGPAATPANAKKAVPQKGAAVKPNAKTSAARPPAKRPAAKAKSPTARPKAAPIKK
jgi:hypothetical protein